MWEFASNLASAVTGNEDEKGGAASEGQELRGELSMEDMRARIEEQTSQVTLLKSMILEKESSLQKHDSTHKKLSAEFSKFKLKAKSQITSLNKKVERAERGAMDTFERASVGSDESGTSEMSSASNLTNVEVDPKTRAKLTLLRKQLMIKESKSKELSNELEMSLKKIEVKERVIKEREDEFKKIRENLERENAELKKRPDGDDLEVTVKKLQSQLHEMVTQMSQKDEKILNLLDQLTAGEGGALDLREMVSEKDEVIKGRDQAISILRGSLQESSKREDKMQATVDKMKWRIDDLEEEVQKYKSSQNKPPPSTSLTASELTLSTTASTETLTTATETATTETATTETATTATETTTTATETMKKLEGEDELEEVTEMREKFSLFIKQENDKFEIIKADYEYKISDLEGVISSLKDDLNTKDVATILEKNNLEEKVILLSEKLRGLEEGDDGDREGKFGKFKALAGSKIKALEHQMQKLNLENQEVANLKARVVELEDEKGSLQLLLIDHEEKANGNKTNGDKQQPTTHQQHEQQTTTHQQHEQQKDQLQQQHELEIDLLDQQHEQKIDLLEQQYQQLEEVVVGKDQELRRCKDRLAEVEKCVAEMEGGLQEKDGRISELGVMVEEYSGKIEAISDSVEVSTAELARKIKECDKVKAKLSQKESKITELSSNLESLNSQFSQVKDELNVRRKLIEESETELSLKVKEVEGLNVLLEGRAQVGLRASEDTLLGSSESSSSPIYLTPSSSSTFFTPTSPSSENLKRETRSPRRTTKFKQLKWEEKEVRGVEKIGGEDDECKDSEEEGEVEKYKKQVAEITCKYELANDEHVASVNKLKEVLDKLKTENEFLKHEQIEEIGMNQNEIKEINKNLKIKSEDLESLAIEYDKMKVNENKLQNNLTLLTEISEKSKEDYERMINGLKGKIENASLEFEENMKEKDKTLVGLSEDLDATFAKFKIQHEEVEAFKKQKEDLTVGVTKLNERLSEIEEEKTTLRDELKEKEEKIDHFKQELLSKEQLYNEKCKEVESMEFKLKESLIEAEKKLKTSFDETKSNSDLQEIIQKLNEQILGLENLVKDSKNVILDKDKLIESITKDVENTKVEKGISEVRIKELTKNVEAANVKVEEFEKYNSEYVLKIKYLEDKLEGDIIYGREKDNLIEKFSQENENISQQNKELISTKEKFLKDNLQLTEKLSTYKQKFEEEKKAFSEENINLIKQIKDLNKVKIENEKLMIGKEVLERDLSNAEERVVKLGVDLKEERRGLEELRRELEEMSVELSNEVKELKKNLSIKSEEALKLSEALAEKEVVLKKYVVVMKKQKEAIRQSKQEQVGVEQDVKLKEEVGAAYKSKVEVCEKQFEGLKEENEKLKVENTNFAEKERILESLKACLGVDGIAQIEAKITDLLNNFDETQHEFLKVKQEVKHQLNEETVKMKHCESENEALKEDRKALEDRIAESKKESDELLMGLREELGAYKDEVAVKSKQVLRSEDKLNATLNRMNEMKKRSDEDSELFSMVKRDLETDNLKIITEIQDFRSNVKGLDEKIKDLEEKLQDSDAEQHALTSRINVLESEKQKLNDEKVDIDELKTRIQHLNDEKVDIDELKTRIQHLNDEIVNKERIIYEKSDELTKISERFDTLVVENDKNIKDLEALEEEKEKLRRSLESSSESLKTKFEESMKVEIETLRQSSEKVELDTVKELQVKLEMCAKSKDELFNECNVLKGENEKLEKVSNNLTLELNNETKKCQVMKAELNKLGVLEEEIGRLKEEKVEWDSKAKKLEKELKKSKSSAEKLNENVKMLKYTEEKLKEQLKEDETKIIQLNKDIKQEKVTFSAKITELSDKIKILEDEKLKLVSDCDERVVQRDRQHEEAEDLLRKELVAEVEMTRERAEMSGESTVSELKDLRSQYDLLSNDLSSYEAINADLEASKKNLEKLNKNLKSEFASLSSEVTEHKQTISSLNERIFTLNSDVSIQEQELSALKSDVKQLNEKLRKSEEGADDGMVSGEVWMLEGRVREMEEDVRASKLNEDRLSEMNEKLLQHNNSLITSNQELFDQVNNLSMVSNNDLGEERVEEVKSLKNEIFILKSELNMVKSENGEFNGRLVKEEVIQARSQNTLQTPEHADDPARTSQPPESAEGLQATLKATRDKLATKEQELADFYQQYQLLYQQFVPLQQHSLDSQQQVENLKKELLTYTSSSSSSSPPPSSSSSSGPTIDPSNLIPLETYQIVEARLNQSQDDLRNVETRLAEEVQKTIQLEVSIAMMKQQTHQQQQRHNKNNRDQHLAINMFGGDDNDDGQYGADDNDPSKKSFPSSANLMDKARYTWFQLRRRFMRFEQTRISLGTAYRYRGFLINFFIFYCILIHLFLFRCWLS